MSKKILAIVEGEKKEPQLLNRLFDTYKERRQIVSYGANLYDLYERIRSYYGDDLEDWDFLFFYASRKRTKRKRKSSMIDTPIFFLSLISTRRIIDFRRLRFKP